MKLLRNNPKIYKTIDGDMVVTRLLRRKLRVSINGTDSIAHNGRDSRKLQRVIGKMIKSGQSIDKIWDLFNLKHDKLEVISHHVRPNYDITVSHSDNVVVITYTTSRSETEYIFSGPDSSIVAMDIDDSMHNDHLLKVDYDIEPYLNWLVSNWTER